MLNIPVTRFYGLNKTIDRGQRMNLKRTAGSTNYRMMLRSSEIPNSLSDNQKDPLPLSFTKKDDNNPNIPGRCLYRKAFWG